MRGEQNPLGLPKVAGAVVLLVDGLGASQLGQRAGHALGHGDRQRVQQGRRHRARTLSGGGRCQRDLSTAVGHYAAALRVVRCR